VSWRAKDPERPPKVAFGMYKRALLAFLVIALAVTTAASSAVLLKVDEIVQIFKKGQAGHQVVFKGDNPGSIEGNVNGYMIVGGTPTANSGRYPLDFRLYTWSGDRNQAADQRAADLTGLSPEGIVQLPPAPWTPSSLVQLVSDNGTKVYYGDGTRIDLLRTAGAETAEAILFCQDGQDLNREKLEAVLEAFPHAMVMVRVYDRRQVMEFSGLDVGLIQRELFESAVVMGREALLKLGIARRETDRVEAAYRERDSERLQVQSATGDLRAAQDRMFGADSSLPDEPVRDPA
jgi:voltage-gated potassium channel Kch